MLIQDILDLDAAERPSGAMKNVLGDGLLLNRNPIYRNVRAAARARGFSFVKTWPEYASGSLMELERILNHRKIPLHFNRPLLETLNARSARPLRLDELPSSINNYHLHEAAHCIAEDVCKNIKPRTKSEKILKAFICESFANATEALACAFTDSDEHEFFLYLNSYMRDPRSVSRRKARMVRELGIETSFMIIMISYLHANFLYEELSLSCARRALKFADPKRKAGRDELTRIKRVMDVAMRLNIEFRVKTNSFYLACQGIDGNLLDLLDFDFLKTIESSPRWSEPLRQLAKTVAGAAGASAKGSRLG
jgi:hypothetical protein